MKINIDVSDMGEAVRFINGGCGVSICSFLNTLPYKFAYEISTWINETCPINGYDLLHYTGEANGWETFDMSSLKAMYDS